MEILKTVGYGWFPIDLLPATSSETIQSLLQEPISEPIVADGQVSRADQCRLLFLSQEGFHKRVPISKWGPFGGNPIQDTDLDVQIYVQCKGYRLRYKGCTGTSLTEPRHISHLLAVTRFLSGSRVRTPIKHQSTMGILFGIGEAREIAVEIVEVGSRGCDGSLQRHARAARELVAVQWAGAL